MRIAIGQLWQESNTFNPCPTTREHYEQLGVTRGPDVVERFAQMNELGGFIQSLRGWPERPEIVGLVRCGAWPSGAATRATFDWLRQEIVGAVRQALPVDGVLLALHGALVAEGHPDVEGEILEAVREVVGWRVPLVATLDLHTNLTVRMVEAADVLVLYHTMPHVDVLDTGRRAAGVLRRILDGARPVTAFLKLPLVVPPQLTDTQDPASPSYPLTQQLRTLEAQPPVLAAGLAMVQPWLDIPDLGGAVLVTTDGDAELAARECQWVARSLWDVRRQLLPAPVSAADAVAEAFSLATNEPFAGPVVLSDGVDATTSGAPGDSNWLLRELLRYDWPRPALVTLVAPDVVELAQRHGVGAELTVPLGGKLDHRFSRPLELTVGVLRLFDARFMLSGHIGTNMPIDMGPSAVLGHGPVHILVTAQTGPHFAPELFQTAGEDPFAASVVVAKSPCGFRAVYRERARQIIVVQAPGCAPIDFWKHEYRNIGRPLWPWDEIDYEVPPPRIVSPRQ